MIMKRLISFFTICVSFFSVVCADGIEKKLSDYVRPNIGAAHCRWFFYTPAALPFGMAKAAPSTNGHYGNASGWEAVGYDNRHNSIEGFANFHEFQVGGVVIAPTVGKLQTLPGSLEQPDSGYRSRFDKKDEVAHPGYYSVYLKDYGIRAELTATKRVAFHRYTFPKSTQSHLLFDIGNKQGESGEVKDALVRMNADGSIDGYVVTLPVYVNIYQKGADVKMYFHAEISKKPQGYGTFIGEKVSPKSQVTQGKGCGMYLDFNTDDKESIEVKVGLSYTSIENARLNLREEASNMSFDKAWSDADKIWNNYLGRIAVEGGKMEDRIKFYTGLFHALLGRGLASDVNGAYPRNDGSVGQIELGPDGSPIHQHYNTDAVWGAFWNLTQLWTLAYPEYLNDFVQSQLLVYKDAGWLGDGIACSRYVSGVGTNFTGLVMAAAYNCGIRKFNVPLAYEAALKNEVGWRGRVEGAGKMDVRQFVERGYSPYERRFKYNTNDEGSGFAVSHTLEYSFSSYAVAQFAKRLGKKSDYKQLSKLSNGWRLLYDKSVNLVRPKDANGVFLKDFNPLEPWVGFQEGNAVQYTFYVPHHIEQLVKVMGKDTFNYRLNEIFIKSEPSMFGGGTTIDAFSGLEATYNHGNQPDLHASWLFNFSGKPWLSQKWVNAILNNFYGTEDIHGYGYGQDEDQGQLGAWYVMGSIGLFDVKGLTEPNPTFQSVVPLFNKITIKLNPEYYTGKTFTIEVNHPTPKSIYTQEIWLNGKRRNTVQVPFNDIIKGGNMVIKASESPNYKLNK